MSVATEIQRLQGAKASLKTSIENKGVTVPSSTKLDGYSALVEQIQQGGDTDGMNGFLSVESKTISTSASATTNITYNKKCGILDENYKKWDTLAWHQRWVDNGYSATGLSKPIGIWMKAFGLDIVFLWPLTSNVSYSDVTGTITLVNNVFSIGLYNCIAITSATAADRTVWPANQSDMIAHGTAGKYKSATFRTVNNGDGLDMICDNTLETFTIPSRNVGDTNAFMKDNADEYMESFYQQCEFFRALFAICSGIATTQPNGTKTNVDILNASGQQAAVNEDMYFWIGGTNTGLYAKYNLNCIPNPGGNENNGLLTQSIADNIYTKQKANGVNMNDTGVNSSSKHVLYEGAKGAEAVAVNGYWYIKTPYLSATNGTSFAANSNIADAPAIYICKHKGLVLPTERMLYPYWLNKTTHISSIVNLLKTTEGLIDIPNVANSFCFSITRYNRTNNWSVFFERGNIQNYTISTRCTIIACPLSTQQYT